MILIGYLNCEISSVWNYVQNYIIFGTFVIKLYRTDGISSTNEKYWNKICFGNYKRWALDTDRGWLTKADLK